MMEKNDAPRRVGLVPSRVHRADVSEPSMPLAPLVPSGRGAGDEGKLLKVL